jgi:hypothetical protein
MNPACLGCFVSVKDVPISFKSTQATPLLSLFAVVAVVLAGLVFYEQFFDGGSVEFGPVLMWLAITVPAAIFAGIFLQVRTNEQSKNIPRHKHVRVFELETESRGSHNRRNSAIPPVANSQPDKDPFESL